MDQPRDILADLWYCGITNRLAIKIVFLIDCILFILGAVLFIRNALVASNVLSFLILDFLTVATSNFQCILAGMTLKKMRLNQNVLFLKHYVNMKVLHLVFFGTEYGIYVPIVCKDSDFRDQHEHICTYVGLRLPTFIVWFLLQLFLLSIVSRIFLQSKRDPRFQQRRVILENIYQLPVAESQSQQVPQNEPIGITVESEGMPFSLVNSGPVPFKIVESLSVRRKIMSKKHEKKYKDQNIEQVDIRYLVMSNTRTIQQKAEEKVYIQVPNKRRFENQSEGKVGGEESYPMRNQNTDQMMNMRRFEDYNINNSLKNDGILTRNK